MVVFTFELFPYGIWNQSSLDALKPVETVFELFPYGIWNQLVSW